MSRTILGIFIVIVVAGLVAWAVSGHPMW